jgi:hypothetical protein
VPEIHQADLTVEQQLSQHDVFSISWLGSWGRRLPDFVDTNLPTPTQVSFTVPIRPASDRWPTTTTFQGQRLLRHQQRNHRPNANFSSITDIFSGVTSNYEALVGSFKHQISSHVSFNANYTWSHALDYGENNTTGASATALLDPIQHQAGLRQLQPECAEPFRCLRCRRFAVEGSWTAGLSRQRL